MSESQKNSVENKIADIYKQNQILYTNKGKKPNYFAKKEELSTGLSKMIKTNLNITVESKKLIL